MSRLVVPIGFCHVIHSLRIAGDPEDMAVTYGIAPSGDPFLAPADPQALVDDCHDAFGDTVMAAISNQYTLVATEMQYATSSDFEEPLAVAVATGNRVGGADNNPLPQNSAFLVHKRTAQAGRRGRGRFYLPGPAEVEVNAAGAIGSTYLASMQTAISSFLTNLNARVTVGSMYLLHSTSDTIPLPADVPPPDVITALQLDPVIATQRRRLRH